MSVWDTLGAWAIGVVAVFIVLSLVIAGAERVGEWIEDQGALVQEWMSGTIMTAFVLAMLYLIFWGCYKLGTILMAAAASLT